MSPQSVILHKVGVTPMSPLNTPQTLTGQGEHETPLEVLFSTNEIGVTEVSGKGTYGPCVAAPEAPVILGSDPHEERTPEPKGKKPVADVTVLVKYFVYHKQSVMLRTYTAQDTAIIRRTMKLLMGGGLDRGAIMELVDRFYASDYFRTCERPVLMFSSQRVQLQLMHKAQTQTNTDDPILNLMLDDFVRKDDTLPWPKESDDFLRKVVIKRGPDVCYRYPELIAALASHFAHDLTLPDFTTALTNLNDLIIGITKGWVIQQKPCQTF